MKRRIRPGLLLAMLLAAAVPAYANNPPRPDGLFFLILLFPVVVVALRAARAALPPGKKTMRVLGRVALGLCVFFTIGGTEIALIPLLILFCYGLFRGIQVMRLGQGAKRFALGAGVILFTLFAVVNYMASLSWPATPERIESTAIGDLRMIASAQATFQSSVTLDANHNGIGEYGTLEQLVKADLISDRVLAPSRIYRIELRLTGDPARDEKEYLVVAVPTIYAAETGMAIFTVSLLDTFRPPKSRGGRRTFVMDESGDIRWRDLGANPQAASEDFHKWEPI